jgi:hypothetical protein
MVAGAHVARQTSPDFQDAQSERLKACFLLTMLRGKRQTAGPALTSARDGCDRFHDKHPAASNMHRVMSTDSN